MYLIGATIDPFHLPGLGRSCLTVCCTTVPKAICTCTTHSLGKVRSWFSNTRFGKYACFLDLCVMCCGTSFKTEIYQLFNLYVNDLVVELSSTKVSCCVEDVSVNNISYPDDMVLLSPTVRALTYLLQVCERYAQAHTHGLLYNVNKSEFLVFMAVGGK